jgi:hypothetical protein
MRQKRRFHEWLGALIDVSGKSNKDLAAALGYSTPNIISMFKNGDMKVPLPVVPRLAQALHVDPAHMVRRALEEYAPEIADTLDEVAGLATKDERRLLEIHRQVTKGSDAALPDTFYDEYRTLLRSHLFR